MAIMKTTSLLLTIQLVGCWMGRNHAFVVFPTRHDLTKRIQQNPSSFSNIILFAGKKMKRGQLGKEIAGDGMATTTTNRKMNKKVTTAKKNPSSSSSATISPDLVNWMATKQQKGEENDPNALFDTTAADDSAEEEEVVSFEQFVESVVEEDVVKSSRGRENQSLRQAQHEAANAQLENLVEKLEQVLEEQSGQIDDILKVVQELVQVPSTLSLKQLFAARQPSNYRLAWVGSDDAICHVGTGLHKVPLARLQEVFFNALGKNRVELLEVIRLLGPFPNVKNTLQGTIQYANNNNNNNDILQITMDSMVDGTGKEIMAGTADNIRRVSLQVELVSEPVLVMVVPNMKENKSTRRSDPLQDNGQHILVFVKEDELNEKLDALRVS
jgi:hypothetical protein